MRRDFHRVVNMTEPQLEEWLKTAESKSVGLFRFGSGESVGHASGRRIVSILGKPAAQLDESDYAHMRKVVGYVKRHSAQRPQNTYTSRWRYSLMNWGHDPLKDALERH